MSAPEALLQHLITSLGVPVEQHTARAGAVHTSYLVAGSGPPVLLLHGGGGSAIGWYPAFAPLAVRYRVIAPDMVGHGLSDKPSARYDRPYLRAWLEAFLDGLGIERASIVAHSTGGAVALQLALDSPERLDKLVLVNSVGLGPGARIPVTLALLMMWQNVFPTRALGQWFLKHYVLSAPEQVNDAMLALEQYERCLIGLPGGRRFFWQGRGRVLRPFPMRDLARVRHPTLLIWGDADRNYPLAQAEAALQVMPNARLEVIHKAGHVCFREQPAQCAKALIHFLQ